MKSLHLYMLVNPSFYNIMFIAWAYKHTIIVLLLSRFALKWYIFKEFSGLDCLFSIPLVVANHDITHNWFIIVSECVCFLFCFVFVLFFLFFFFSSWCILCSNFQGSEDITCVSASLNTDCLKWNSFIIQILQLGLKHFRGHC